MLRNTLTSMLVTVLANQLSEPVISREIETCVARRSQLFSSFFCDILSISPTKQVRRIYDWLTRPAVPQFYLCIQLFMYIKNHADAAMT